MTKEEIDAIYQKTRDDAQFQQFEPSSQSVSPLGAQKRTNATRSSVGLDPAMVEDSGTSGMGAILGEGIMSLAEMRSGKGITRGVKGILGSESKTTSGAIIGDALENLGMQAYDPARQVTFNHALLSAGEKGAASFGGGMVGRGVVGTVGGVWNKGKTIINSFRSKITPEGTAVVNFVNNEVARLGLKYDGTVLTLAERTRSATLDVIDNTAKNSFAGAEIYSVYGQERTGIFKAIGESIRDSFGGKQADPAVIGDVFAIYGKDSKGFLKQGAVILRNTVEHYVTNIKRLFGQTGASRVKAKETMQIIANTGDLAAKAQGKGVAKGVIKATDLKVKVADTGLVDAQGKPIHRAVFDDEAQTELFGGLNIIMEQIANMPPTKPVSELIQMRSALLTYQKQISKTFELADSPLAKNINDHIGHMNNSIEDALRQPGVPPQLIEMWKDSNEIFSGGKKLYNDAVAKAMFSLAEDSPAGFVKGLVKLRDEGIGGLRMLQRAKEMLLPKGIDVDKVPINLTSRFQTWKKIQSEAMTNIFDNTWDRKIGQFTGSSFLDNLDKYDKPMLNELFGKETTERLYAFGETMLHVQTKNPISTGSMAIQFMQIGAAMALVGGDLKVEAAGLLIIPAVLAQLMTNKKGVELLTKGVAMSKFDPAWPALASRITTTLAVSQLEDKVFMADYGKKRPPLGIQFSPSEPEVRVHK